MPTKIINILRDDKLEDVLDLFRKTPAQEVIFVLPKRSFAFDSEESFSLLAQEAQEMGKNVLMLTSNPDISELALKYNFGLLTSTSKNLRKAEKNPDNIENNKEIPDATEIIKKPSSDNEKLDESKLEEQRGLSDDNILSDNNPDDVEVDADASLATFDSGDINYIEPYLVSTTRKTKPISDIVSPSSEQSVNLEVVEKNEKPAKVQIKKDISREDIVSRPEDLININKAREQSITDQIQNVWQSKRTEADVKIERQPMPGSYLGKISRPMFRFNFQKRIVTIFAVLSVLILAAVLYVSVGSAKIILKPKSHTLDIQKIQTSISDKFTSVDLETKKIPGQLFSIEKKVEKTFNATGEKDVAQKARGKIVVYNEYGTTPQILIATTRFESEDGLIFRTLKTITVPGTKVQNGKIIPGTIEVEIIADKAGGDYNIDSGNFKIPAFKENGDLDRYQKFYGKSTEAIKGGIVGKAKVITEEDYIKAKEDVQKTLVDEITRELDIQSTGLKFLTQVEPNFADIVSSGQVDEAMDEFTVSLSAKLENIAYKESDLYDLISAFVKKTNDFEVFPDKLDIKIDDIEIGMNEGLIRFNLSFKGLAYSKIDQESIITDLMGKNEGQIKEYIVGKKEISSTKVILSPFWVRKVPRYKDKISIELQYE